LWCEAKSGLLIKVNIISLIGTYTDMGGGAKKIVDEEIIRLDKDLAFFVDS